MSFTEWLGLKIFDPEPDWSKKVSWGAERESWVARKYAAAYSESHQTEATVSWEWEYLLETQEEIQEFIDFFDEVKGRWGAFWSPSFCSDILISEPFAAGATEIKITDIGYSRMWLPNSCLGRFLVFYFPDGTVQPNFVSAAPADTQLSLAYPLVNACSEDEVPLMMVSFLLLSRFDSDELELQYLLETAARVKMPFITLPPGETPEIE